MTQQLLAAYDSLIGTVLLGRYRVVRELARGGMGVVYLARAEGAGGFVKPVVIKLLLPEHNEDERIVRMFVREARILSQLRHPSLVDVIEFGEQEGAYVLVLEYVRGYHLGLWLRYLAAKQREAPADVLIQIIIDVLEALHHAHTQVHPDGSPMQIVHRDISPSNILLDDSGHARLLDFGVARMRGGAQDYKTQVQGGVMGKLPYTAPEIFSGAEASPQSDVYGCAVVLHEALYGQNVFRAETQAATLSRVLAHVAEPVERARPDVPAGLDAVLGAALAKDVSERHADAHELATALRRLLRYSESELRARLAQMLKDDFGPEMSRMFNLESLADREAAWRSEGAAAPPASRAEVPSQPANENAAPGPRTLKPQIPAPLGATVVNARATRPAGPRAGGHGAPTPGTGIALTPAALFDDEPLEELSTNKQHVPSAKRARESETSSLGGEPITVQQRSVFSTQPTRRTQANPALQPAAAGERSAPVTTAQPAPELPRALPPSAATPSSKPRGRWIGIALAVAAGAAIASLANHARAPRPQPSAAPVQVRPEPPPVTQPVAQPEPPPPPPVEGAAGAAPPSAAVTPTPEPHPAHTEPKDRPPRRAAPDANALTRALRKQQPKLEACFRQHSKSVEGQPVTQLVFDLDADGTLTHVELSPKVLSTTALGQCLLKVARSTSFPAQSRAVSFVIPLTARTGPDG
jgi:serine/threonine-protein kinase